MKNVKLTVVKNELRNEKRVLPPDIPMALVPPDFKIELIDFMVKNIKWYTSIFRFDSRM